jgi:hypothetical protein
VTTRSRHRYTRVCCLSHFHPDYPHGSHNTEYFLSSSIRPSSLSARPATAPPPTHMSDVPVCLDLCSCGSRGRRAVERLDVAGEHEPLSLTCDIPKTLHLPDCTILPDFTFERHFLRHVNQHVGEITKQGLDNRSTAGSREERASISGEPCSREDSEGALECSREWEGEESLVDTNRHLPTPSGLEKGEHHLAEQVLKLNSCAGRQICFFSLMVCRFCGCLY